MVHTILGLEMVNIALIIMYSEFYVVLLNIRRALVVSIFSVEGKCERNAKVEFNQYERIFDYRIYNFTQRN